METCEQNLHEDYLWKTKSFSCSSNILCFICSVGKEGRGWSLSSHSLPFVHRERSEKEEKTDLVIFFSRFFFASRSRNAGERETVVGLGSAMQGVKIPPHWLQLFLQFPSIQNRSLAHSPAEAQNGHLGVLSLHSNRKETTFCIFSITTIVNNRSVGKRYYWQYFIKGSGLSPL